LFKEKKMSKASSFIYPFTALVGQEKMKKGLILNAVNPRLGGILIRGEKGTAKSTAVRALASLLPEIEVVEGCPYSCHPDRRDNFCSRCSELFGQGKTIRSVRQVQVIDLPVSATEDRLLGSLDFEYAIKYGRPRFEPGLLAKANRGIIYVDEVNLLDDHLVDALLDAASMGVNTVEREGVSFSHPAEFILVGTMNPEEGELRPQLLDRFGLCVQVEGAADPTERVEIARRREAFDYSPLEFIVQWSAEESCLRERIVAARQLLSQVTISLELLDLVARLSLEAFVSGHRADIIMANAARTIAAWQGRTEVKEADVYEAAELVLPHRLREASPPHPPEQPEPSRKKEEEPSDQEQEDESSREQEMPERLDESSSGAEERPEPESREQQKEQDREKEEGQSSPSPASMEEVIFSIGEPFPVRRISYERDRVLRKGSGRRSRTKTASRTGRYVRSTMERNNNDLAFDATIRAASPYQLRRQREKVAIAIESSDIREKIREKRIGNFLLFVVDASGSMGARQRMVETKGAILSLLLDAYQKRDHIGMIAFKGNAAEVLLPPTNSVERAEKLLAELPTGGKTPLSSGLAKAYEVAIAHLYKDPNIFPLLIIISDGKANMSMGKDRPLAEARRVAEFISREEKIKTLVIDVEPSGFLSFGLARELAGILGARYYKIADLKADTLVEAIRKA